jgi:hypothetical protein
MKGTSAYRPTIGVSAVILFLVPVTLVMHNFWAIADPTRMIEFHAFLSNVTLAGSALLLFGVPQPWGWRVKGTHTHKASRLANTMETQSV